MTATISKIEAFTWNFPDGETVTWNITKAKEIVAGRTPDTVCPVDAMRIMLERNTGLDVNTEHAKTVDLSQPIIAVVTGVSEFFDREPEIHVTVIDGWHRIYRAVQDNHAAGMPVCFLQPDEDHACRIERL